MSCAEPQQKRAQSGLRPAAVLAALLTSTLCAAHQPWPACPLHRQQLVGANTHVQQNMHERGVNWHVAKFASSSLCLAPVQMSAV